jgi:DNA-binding NarL/FixJ family response regulator
VTTSVLVVDDDAGFRGLAVRVLSACAFDVVGEAATGEAGMAAAIALRPDAILLDVRLPDANGIQLGRVLAALPWTPRVVLTSSDSDVAGEIAADGDGLALAFVPKDELTGAPLEHLLAGH